MATYFSDHMAVAAAGVDAIAMDDPSRPVSAGRKHARLRKSIAVCSLAGSDPANADQLRYLTMKSSDRLFSIKLSSELGFTALTNLDLGVYYTGDNHDGAVLDIDLFADDNDIAAAQASVEMFTVGALANVDIGKMLWELVNVGVASTFSEDPAVDFDIVGTLNTTGAAGGYTHIEVEYTSGA